MSDSDFAPDGSPVEVFARLGAGTSPGLISARLAGGASILDLGCGAGRISDALAQLGHNVLGVDQSQEMLDKVKYARTMRSRIEDLDVAERFAAVLLPSYLINEPERERAHAMLCTAVRHVAPDGYVFVQRFDPVRGVQLRPGPTLTRNGVTVIIEDVEVEDMLVSATSVYCWGGDRTWRQRWSFLAIADDELRHQLASVGLNVIGPLADDLDWIVAQ